MDDSPLLPAGILVVLATLVGFVALPADPDLWFHLADGEYILANGQVPQTDLFSFTRAGELWVPHSWLFDVIVTGLWHRLGPRAAEACLALVFMPAILLAFGILVWRGVSPMAALAVCTGLAIAAGNTRGIRPQVFSLLLAAVVLSALVAHRHRPTRRVLFVLPPLFLLWAQLHGACVVGLVLMAVWLSGRVLEALVGGRLRAQQRELLILGAALVASALAILITPHAITHYEYAAQTMSLQFLKTRVSEWQPPQALALRSPDVFYFLLILGVLAALARSRNRIGWAELGVAGALIVLAASATRHIPLACLGSVPLLAEALGRPAIGRAPAWGCLRRSVGIIAAGCAVVFALLWRVPMPVDTRYSQAEPTSGARALAALNAPLRVFTTYNTGAYVLWSAPRRLRVFVDSRADVYGDELLGLADAAVQGRGWEALFREWDVQAAVVERRDPLARELTTHEDWRLLAEDPGEVTFVRVDLGGAGALAAQSADR